MTTIDDSGSNKFLHDPDVVSQSPITADRIVDTQSGFMVTVRRVQERLALSVKRRLGTPPQSQILLTPDESVKLSRILSDGWTPGQLEPTPEHDFAIHRPSDSDSSGFKPIVLIMVVLALCNFAAGSFAGYFAHQPAKVEVRDPLAKRAIDHFAYGFVSNLLDFNPETYKVSQVRAMAAMTPELQNTYWSDTNFPLTAEQLAALGQSSKVQFTNIDSQKLDAQTAQADVQGQMVENNGAKTTPVHLQLKLILDSDGQIKVSEQNDLTSQTVTAPNAPTVESNKTESNTDAVDANVPKT